MIVYINTLHNELKYFTICVGFLYFNRSARVNYSKRITNNDALKMPSYYVVLKEILVLFINIFFMLIIES